MPAKLKYEYVYNYFKEQGCELLESEYITSDTKMKYRCSCGNISSIIWDNFKHGSRCFDCGIQKICNKRKHKYNYIKNEFEKRGWKLISKEYNNSKEKLNTICNNGHKHSITYSDFNNGYGCRTCHYESISNKNHYKWKPNREEINILNRLRIQKHKRWIKNNLQHDPNYNEYLLNSKKYHLDHIIPISIFSKFVLEFKLDEQKIKNIINQTENLQILPAKENLTKSAKGSIFEAAQYLMLNGIKLT